MLRATTGALAPLTFCCLLSVQIAAALALQDDPQSDPQTATNGSIETLIIASPAAAWSAAGAVSGLDGEALQDTSFAHPYEVFARLPGAWVSRGSGQEHLTALRSPVLTGPGACGSFLILEDGVPIRPTGFCNVNNLFETTMELATGLQVVRGPAAAVYGGNALHGAINFDFDGNTGTQTQHPEAYLRLGVGPWQYGTATLNWRGGTPSDPIGLGLFAATDGSYRQAAGYDLQKLRFSQGRAGDNADLQWSVSAVNLQQETAGYIEGANLYKAADSVRRGNQNPEAFRDARAVRVLLHRQAARPGATSDIRAWARFSDMAFLLHFLPCKPLEQNDHRSVGGSWQSGHQSKAAEWAWGLLAESARVHLDQYQQTPSANCGINFRPQRFSQGSHYNYDVDSRNLALWGRGRHILHTASANAAALLWDLRLEQLDYDYDNALPAGIVDNQNNDCGGAACRYSRPADGRDRFSLLGARLALAFRPAHWRWHLALASGYRPPQIGELYRLQQGQQTTDLQPEMLLQLEWGGRWQSERLNLQWAVYTADKRHFIFRDSTRAIQPDGATEHLGMEVSLRAQLATAHSLQLALSLAEHRYDFFYSEIGGAEVRSGNEVDTAPGELASLVWQWRSGGGTTANLRLEAEWLHTGAYYTDAANAHSYPGQNLLNLRLSFQPLAHWSVHLRLHNALDTAYADRADYTPFGGDRYFPGLPRALYLSARWDLSRR